MVDWFRAWCKAWFRLIVVHEIGLGVFPVLLLGVLVDLFFGVGMDIGMNVGWVCAGYIGLSICQGVTHGAFLGVGMGVVKYIIVGVV